MSDMISLSKFAARMKKLQVPEGFTATWEEEVRWRNAPPAHIFVLKSEGIELRFDQTGSGHTLFQSGKATLSFDRLGVEDSFYHLPLWDGDKTRYDLNKIVAEQLKRIEKALASMKTAIQVPSIPFTVQPEKLGALKTQLKKTGSIRFMPSGFGTGYIIGKSLKGWGTKRAPQELEKFFGITPLFVNTFDAD